MLEILNSMVQNIHIPLPALRSCDRPNNLKSSSITNRIYSPYNFSIHWKQLSHHEVGGSKFLRNVSKFHQLTVRKATESSSDQLPSWNVTTFCVVSKLLTDVMARELALKYTSDSRQSPRTSMFVRNSIRTWVTPHGYYKTTTRHNDYCAKYYQKCVYCRSLLFCTMLPFQHPTDALNKQRAGMEMWIRRNGMRI